MKCSKCGNELKENNKFCTKCGTPIENSTNIKTSINGNNYSIQKDYNIMWGMVALAIIINIAFWVVGLGFDIKVIIIEFVIFGILVAMGAFGNILFKCPNCKEEVTLNQNILTTINNIESTYNCPKCNTKLIFNNEELSVKINNEVEKVQSNNSNTSDAEKLEELYNLKKKGIISEEEFENKKKEILHKI